MASNNYNPFLDVKNYRFLPDVQGEVIPKVAIFSCFRNEELQYDNEGVLNPPYNTQSLISQPLNEQSRNILSIIASYNILNTRMITDIYSMCFGENLSNTHVLKSIERLRKTGLINVFKFHTLKFGTANYIVCHITQSGINAARNLDIIATDVNQFNFITSNSISKKKLQINQLSLCHIKNNGTNIKWFEKSKRIAVETVSGTVPVRPSLIVSFKGNDDEENLIMYEVVRTGGFWESTLQDKLNRYKTIIEHWKENNCSFSGDAPPLVLCCESEYHSREVKKIVDNVGIDVFYTHDLLLFGKLYEQHLYTFAEDGTQEYYYFRVSDDKK